MYCSFSLSFAYYIQRYIRQVQAYVDMHTEIDLDVKRQCTHGSIRADSHNLVQCFSSQTYWFTLVEWITKCFSSKTYWLTAVEWTKVFLQQDLPAHSGRVDQSVSPARLTGSHWQSGPKCFSSQTYRLTVVEWIKVFLQLDLLAHSGRVDHKVFLQQDLPAHSSRVDQSVSPARLTGSQRQSGSKCFSSKTYWLTVVEWIKVFLQLDLLVHSSRVDQCFSS